MTILDIYDIPKAVTLIKRKVVELMKKLRFGAHVMTMKKSVEQGKIGQVVSGYSQFTLWLPRDAGNWRQEKAKSGGA